MRPLAVCSSKSADLALSYGAERAFDYTAPACDVPIKRYTRGRLNRVLDIIADAASIKLCYGAMGRLGGRYVGLELLPESRPKKKLIRASWVLGQTVFGKELRLGGGYEWTAMPSHRELGRRWFNEVQELWFKGVIKPHPVVVEPQRGLERALDGIDRLRRGAVARQ